VAGGDPLLEERVAPSWRTVAKLGDPEDFPGKIFVGWCRDLAPVSGECFRSGEKFPIVDDTELYEVWIDTPAPTSIQIGDRTFSASDFEYDAEDNAIYLTAESSSTNPLVGGLNIRNTNPFAFFDTDSDSISAWDFSGNTIERDLNSDWNFEPKCDAGPDCSEIYVISGIPLTAGSIDQSPITLYILVAPDTEVNSDLTYDFGNEAADVVQNLPMGWYKSLDGQYQTRAGYFTEGWWWGLGDFGGFVESNEYFPLVFDLDLSLIWWQDPHISVPISVTISEGDTDVATAECDDDYDCTWLLEGNTGFEISENGEISANPTLAIGTYTFTVTTVEDELPSVEMTVNVVAATPTPTPTPTPTHDNTGVVVGASAKLVVPGFALDSAKLTPKMKRAIKKFVGNNPTLTTVACKGFTSLPFSARDTSIGTDRGKAVCNFIKKLNPDLSVKVLKGGHNNKAGSETGRVRIAMR